jgi:UPF0176 protein
MRDIAPGATGAFPGRPLSTQIGRRHLQYRRKRSHPLPMDSPILIAAFYKFVTLPDYRDLRQPLLDRCRAACVRGTILLAREGINATIAGARPNVEAVVAYLRDDPRLADLRIKESLHDTIPFGRMKVRLKREIVALKAPGADPTRRAGVNVEPKDWNRLIGQDDVTLIDARNAYEIRMGSFPGARNPGTDSFHEIARFLAEELDPTKHKRVAMYCTGGIRCEKASAFLLNCGIDEVYQLRGGILNYLDKVERDQSLWQGECFVFDERVSLDHDLKKGRITICDDCKAVVKLADDKCPQCGSANFL